jgi:hypothetical protein
MWLTYKGFLILSGGGKKKRNIAEFKANLSVYKLSKMEKGKRGFFVKNKKT